MSLDYVQYNRLFLAAVGFAVAIFVGAFMLYEAHVAGLAMGRGPIALVAVGALGIMACGWISRSVGERQRREAEAPRPPGRPLYARTRWVGWAVISLLFVAKAAGLAWMMWQVPTRDFGSAIFFLLVIALFAGVLALSRFMAPNPLMGMDEEGIAHADIGHIPWEHVSGLELVQHPYNRGLQQAFVLAVYSDYAAFYNRRVPKFVMASRKLDPTGQRFLGAVMMPLLGLDVPARRLYENAVALHGQATAGTTSLQP